MRSYKTKKQITRIALFAIILVAAICAAPLHSSADSTATYPAGPKTEENGIVTWDCVYFGYYPQSNDGKGGFKVEPIKWRVLHVDGDDAFLIADKHLDVQPFNRATTDITWDRCTLRSWLNGYSGESNKSGVNFSSNNFIDKAFTSSEQEAIYDTDVSGIARDKIYLLSIGEAQIIDYGFPNDWKVSPTREVKETDYASKKGIYTGWWLRSSGDILARAACMDFDGGIKFSGVTVSKQDVAVRPVLHMNLSSGKWNPAGTVSSDGTENEVELPEGGQIAVPTANALSGTYKETKNVKLSTETAEADIYYTTDGTAPSRGNGTLYQKAIAISKDTTLKAIAIKRGMEDSEIQTYSYQVKTDAQLAYPRVSDDGVATWDCVYFGKYAQTRDGDGNYREEAIRWRVLSVEGEDAFLMADQPLETMPYNQSSKYITWEQSTLRSWLNGYDSSYNADKRNYTSDSFMKKAFNEAERSAIRETNVINTANPTYNTNGGANTKDKIYLLSIAECKEAAFGFKSSTAATPLRQASGTDYVTSRVGNSVFWWLRSPGRIGSEATRIEPTGIIGSGGYGVIYDNAVRPVLHINISSNQWKAAGEVSSDGKGSRLLMPEARILSEDNIGQKTIAISTASAGADIYYTTDGSNPSKSNGKKYINPITINVNTLLKAVSVKDGCRDSGIAISSYKFNTTAPEANVASGTYEEGQTVSLTVKTANAEIFYTVDGSPPTRTNGTKYDKPIVISQNTTLKAVAVKQDTEDSEVTQYEYKIKTAGPQTNVVSGSYKDAKTVTLSSQTAGADIYYTTDGTIPGIKNGIKYQTPIFVDKTIKLRAVAVKEGMEISSIVEFAYRILGGPAIGADRTVTWDCIYFGNYPQSAQSDGNFKTEPIKWRILSRKGNDVFLLADKNLDAVPYDNRIAKSTTWEQCTLRSWLNGYSKFYNLNGEDYTSDGFIKKAFTDAEQKAIIAAVVVNPNNPQFGTSGGNNTGDKVSLLSIDEVQNPAFGFQAEASATPVREAKNTDYTASKGTGYWRLRSPGMHPDQAALVTNKGVVALNGDHVTSSKGLIRPALHFNLASDLWKPAGTMSANKNYNNTPPEQLTGNGIKLEQEAFAYTGKPITPKVKVTTEIAELTEGADYTLEYQDNVNVGDGKVIIKGVNLYTGTVEKTFSIDKASQKIWAKSITKNYGSKAFSIGAKAAGVLTYKSSNSKIVDVSLNGKVTIKNPGKVIVSIKAASTKNYNAAEQKISITIKPKQVTIQSVKLEKSKSLSVKWKRDKQASGYQAVMATNSSFNKNKKLISIIKNSTTMTTFKSLKKASIYYVKVRSFKQVGRTKLYGAYSKVKSVR